MTDEDGGAWLDEHMHRAEDLIWIFYVLVALSAIAIAAPIKWPKILSAARCGGGFTRRGHLGERGLYRLRWWKSSTS